MREFKFRAWENGTMYYQVRCGGVFDDIPTAPTVWNERTGGWSNLTGQPHTKVMQYTGLKDKNGKEIYEGDIVHFEYDTRIGGGYRRAKHNAPVTFSERRGGYVYTFKDSKGEELSFSVDKFSCVQLEVIGNIYENSDLL